MNDYTAVIAGIIGLAVSVIAKLTSYHHQQYQHHKVYLLEMERRTVEIERDKATQARLEKHEAMNELMKVKMQIQCTNLASPAIESLQQELLRLRNSAGVVAVPTKNAVGCGGCGAQIRAGATACEYCGRERRKHDK
jgi:hypothetical protein